MEPVLQQSIPFEAWRHPQLSRLPGILPLDPAQWMVIDEAYAGQMALRDRLIAERREDVYRIAPGAAAAAAELLGALVEHLRHNPAFTVGKNRVIRPDGIEVQLDGDEPLAIAGRLVQDDLCLMQRGEGEDEYRLTGAVLCFPAYWRLDEKFMRPLAAVHRPVADYSHDVARRVGRLFEAMRPDRPLWRANAHLHESPALFSPQAEDARRRPCRNPSFLRSERQTLLRLPQSGAVVFGIHTYMLRLEDLLPEQRASLLASRSDEWLSPG